MTQPPASPSRTDTVYDPVTIALHWVVALLVLDQFTLAMIWGRLPKGPAKALLQHTHVSLGLVLVAALVANTIWTAARARRLPKAGKGLQGVAATVVHRGFVVLIFVQAAIGVSKRWVRGRGVEVFNLGHIPAPFHIPAPLQPALDTAHRLNAYLIMTLVAVHVGAALLHHYAMRDGVLRRMIPALRPLPQG
jgi:cytochrome b561